MCCCYPQKTSNTSGRDAEAVSQDGRRSRRPVEHEAAGSVRQAEGRRARLRTSKKQLATRAVKSDERQLHRRDERQRGRGLRKLTADPPRGTYLQYRELQRIKLW